MARVSALALLVCALALAQTASAQEEWKRYIWIGPPTNSSFDLLLDVAEDESEVILLDNAKGSTNDPVKGRLKVPTNSDPKRPSETYGSKQGKLKFNLHFFQFKNLAAGEVHHIYAEKKDKKEIIYAGSVWTLPAGVGEYFPMKIALGSCQVRSRDAQALQEISMWNKAVNKEDEAFFMLHMGDLHYKNIGTNDPKKYESATRNVVTDFSGRKLFSSVPVAYMVDDHDYGRNNGDANSKSRPAVHKNYDAMITRPSGANVAKSLNDGLYSAFTVGKVRFIITDLRSNADRSKKQLLGSNQMSWFQAELQGAKNMDVIVWVSTRPWIGEKKAGSDTWGGFAEERVKIADFIASEGIRNLVMVSGDAHMLAADDGSNSNYATGGKGGGFPVIHAAPLSNWGSSKGGPYSHGCKTWRLKKNNQYGILTIRRDGNTTMIEYNGYAVSHLNEDQFARLPKRTPLIKMALNAPFNVKGEPGAGKCKIPLAPWWWFLVFALAVIAFLFLCVYCGVKRKARRQEKLMAMSTEEEFENLETHPQLAEDPAPPPREQDQRYPEHNQDHRLPQDAHDHEPPQRF